MSQEKTPFWQSAPGTVAAVAAMVTALAGAVPVIMAVRGNDDKPAGTASPTPTATAGENPGAGPGGPDSFGEEPPGAPDGSAPPVIASPTAMDFGRVSSLSAPTQALQIVNTGENPVTLEGMRIVGPAASSFTIAESTCQEGDELAPDAPCDLKIHFAPSGSGSKQATLIVERSPGGPVQVPLSAEVGLL